MARLIIGSAVIAIILSGCAAASTATPVQTLIRPPPTYRIVNTIRPGNAHGNSITLPESFERSATAVAVVSEPFDGRAIAESAEPFTPLVDDSSAAQWSVRSSTATTEQILGLDLKD